MVARWKRPLRFVNTWRRWKLVAAVIWNLLRRRLISVTGNASRLHAMVRELGCQDIFRVPENVGGRFSVLSPVGLVPAALDGRQRDAIVGGRVAR